VSKPVIILTEILFSIIGVLLGFGITRMQISVVMTGLGIVGLAGIVVKNGILVIEFADQLRERGLRTREAVIQAGKTRIIPVLLTAMAAILALIPLAVGFNINFVTLFSDLNPHIFFGGDSAVFWKPLSWTIIYGLAFAFFMTLVIVPSMYLIAERLKHPMRQLYGGRWISVLGIPPLTPIFLYLMMVSLQLKPLQKFYALPRWLVILFAVFIPVFVILVLARQVIRLFGWIFGSGREKPDMTLLERI
jgi:Cu/Ag efflux pump CusA